MSYSKLDSFSDLLGETFSKFFSYFNKILSLGIVSSLSSFYVELLPLCDLLPVDYIKYLGYLGIEENSEQQ
jgi:hypothetical protein